MKAALRAWLAVVTAAVALLTASVACDPPDDVLLLCESDGGCPDGRVCHRAYCWPRNLVPDGGPDAGDAGPDGGDAGGDEDGGEDGGDAGDDAGVDAGEDAGADAAVAIPIGWSMALPITELNSTAYDAEPTITPDELNFCFSSSRTPASSIDIWCTTRSLPDASFSSPVRQTQLDTGISEHGAELSRDGTELFYTIGEGTTPEDLFRATGTIVQFRDAGSLTLLNAPGWDLAPSLTGDDQLMYFQTDRATGSSGDIHRATRSGNGYGSATRVENIWSIDQDFEPAVHPSGRYMVFSSDRAPPNGEPQPYLWMTVFQQDGGWSDPALLRLTGLSGEARGFDLATDDTLYFQGKVGANWQLFFAEPIYP